MRKMTMANTRLVAAVFLCWPFAACCADIAVSGLFAGKAIIQVDGGRPRTLSTGQMSPEGVKLLSATSEAAVVEYQGRRETVTTGQGTRMGSIGTAGNTGGRTLLTADARGHFVTTGTVNGQTVRFLVDTGASAILLSAAEARRLGIDYLSGPRAGVQTANGRTVVYRVKLDTVKIGDIVINNVDAAVTDSELPVMLLGMSFLNRTEMKRDGDVMTLTKRY